MGEKKGLAEGLAEGEQVGEAKILVKQLEKKFGGMLERDRERIMNASKEQLLEWAERIFDIKEVAELFV